MDAKTAKTKIVKIDDEYVVKTWDANGIRTPNSDYFTTDRADAIATAEKMVR